MLRISRSRSPTCPNQHPEQSGIAALAQANSAQQSILKLRNKMQQLRVRRRAGSLSGIPPKPL